MKITYAKNSLGAALAAAPAQMAHTALVRAEDMLAQIGDDCIARIDVLLAEFPRTAGKDVAEVTRHIYEAYETGRKMIGIGAVAGMPEMDTVDTQMGLSAFTNMKVSPAEMMSRRAQPSLRCQS